MGLKNGVSAIRDNNNCKICKYHQASVRIIMGA